MASSLSQVWPDSATSLGAQVLCAFRCHGSAKPMWEEGDASKKCFGDTSGASGLLDTLTLAYLMTTDIPAKRSLLPSRVCREG